MYRETPGIREPVTELRPRLPQEHEGHKQPRVQMLYLLASGQAHCRQDVAQFLGVHRQTVGRWLALYAAGGRPAFLATDVPAGTPVSLAPAVLASLEAALRRPEGCASSEALRQWVRQTHGVEVKDNTLDRLVRTRFHAKRTGPRPSPTNKAGGHPHLPDHRS